MNKNEVKEIYTVDGTIIRRDGTISTFGNLDLFKKNYKFKNSENKKNIYQ